MKKDIYIGCIEVLHSLSPEKHSKEDDIINALSRKDIYVLVKNELLAHDAVRRNGYGGLSMNDKTQSLIASRYFENLIEDIEKNEYDRGLDNKSKYVGIKYTRYAFWLSFISLIISILATTHLPELFYGWVANMFKTCFS